MRSINSKTLDKAARDAKAGQRYGMQDGECRGLVLRVQPTGPVWQARFENAGRRYRILIGLVDLWQIAWAREACRNIREYVRAYGVPDRAWIDNVRRTRLWEEAGRQGQQPWPAAAPKAERPRGWTYAEACDAWLAHLGRSAAGR